MLERIMWKRRRSRRLPGQGRFRRSGARAVRTDWSLTAESFETFLGWLSPSREDAGRKYEQLRKQLIKFFEWRGCHTPEELSDEAVNRVAKRLAAAGVEGTGGSFAYCYGVARLVLLEYWRKVKPEPMPADVPAPGISPPEWSEAELECLSKCLGQLSAHDRTLITRYYQGDGRERIEIRRELAREVGGANALRIQVFKIRAKLREWMSKSRRDAKQN